MIKRVFVFLLSVPMSIAFINITPNSQWISTQGRYTMQYYIYHAFILTVLMWIVNKSGLPTTFFYASVYFVLIVLILGIASYIPYFSVLTNPISLLLGKMPRGIRLNCIESNITTN